MGIYIKNMNMPIDGCHHIICIYADGTVSTGGKEYTAVPVPPHGDLIERNEIFKKCEFVCTDNDEDIRAVRCSIIENAPVIIPAEEGN